MFDLILFYLKFKLIGLTISIYKMRVHDNNPFRFDSKKIEIGIEIYCSTLIYTVLTRLKGEMNYNNN